ncbi:MAG: hypothetical protein M3246_01980 [Actinomycetota bacterium]|nr:hypothetical protein [Actinomycetota bacterium]
MTVKINDKGDYELFETTRGHRILVLNGERWFAWVEGQQGEILVHTDSDHEKDHTIQEGEFYLADFEDDPNYRDMPHLFLQKEDRFEELILPNGLPTEQDKQKKIVSTDETVPQDELTSHLEQ